MKNISITKGNFSRSVSAYGLAPPILPPSFDSVKSFSSRQYNRSVQRKFSSLSLLHCISFSLSTIIISRWDIGELLPNFCFCSHDGFAYLTIWYTDNNCISNVPYVIPMGTQRTLRAARTLNSNSVQNIKPYCKIITDHDNVFKINEMLGSQWQPQRIVCMI